MIQYWSKTGRFVIADLEFVTEADEQFMLADASGPDVRRDLEYAFRSMREREARWNQHVTPELEAITFGDCWKTVVRVPMSPDLTIWGEVIPLEQIESTEQRASVVRLKDGYGRGWRYSRCYSVNEPAGELGAWHVAKLTPVTRTVFGRARRRGWRP